MKFGQCAGGLGCIIFLAVMTVSCGSQEPDNGLFMKSSTELEKACRTGDSSACTRIGVRKAFGTGGYTRDYVSASRYCKRGCDGGDAAGCKELGVLYEYGRGVRKDTQRAAGYYEKGCAGRVSLACLYLGRMYQRGVLSGVDIDRARVYFDRACDLGLNDGCEAMKAIR